MFARDARTRIRFAIILIGYNHSRPAQNVDPIQQPMGLILQNALKSFERRIVFEDCTRLQDLKRIAVQSIDAPSQERRQRRRDFMDSAGLCPVRRQLLKEIRVSLAG
jgi:hypothetical protein